MTSLPFRIGALAVLAIALPASAQQQQPRILPVSADAAWTHANSGLTMPVTLIGLPRTQVREFEGPELDVVGTYTDDNSELTIYVYRTLAGAVPVWFDRATAAIETRDGWGTLTPLAPTAVAVAPPGRSVASGLAQGWAITGGRYSGTALAVLPMGEWLVKLRYSSKTDTGSQAMEKLRTALAGLHWPTAVKDGLAAVPVAACADTLRFNGGAKSRKPTAESTMMGALMASVVTAKENSDTSQDSIPVTWCRDATPASDGALYRPDGAADAYLLALSDAGRGVQVGRDIGGLFSGKSKPGWSVDLTTPGRTLVYPTQDRLPSPQEVMAIVDGPTSSVVTTWGHKREITINPKAFK